MVKRCLGLDIGGANIKLADTDSYACSWPFAMWSRWEELPDFLERVLAAAPASDSLAVTMTGELADCFRSKSQGVRAILDAVQQAAAGKDVRVYRVDGNWATVESARQDPLPGAAANWHALARFASRAAGEQDFLLVDVGSTTTDLIPVVAGTPSSHGQDDVSRLLAGELVYTGVERTPVCALVESFPYRGEMCPLAAELFATTLDVYLLLGHLSESLGTDHTGDGKERTREAAALRLSRMICADPEQFTESDACIFRGITTIGIKDVIVHAHRAIRFRPRALLVPGRLESNSLGPAVVEHIGLWSLPRWQCFRPRYR